LKSFALGEATIEEIVRPSGKQPNLSVVTAGKSFSNPSEFLDSPAFDEFLTHLRSHFDIVIIDSPPVLPVADAMTLATRCDGVMLVIKIRKGVVLSSEKAVESLRQVEANVLGVIVNQGERQSHYSEYGRYGYSGYGGYTYYAGRYYDKQNSKYYEPDKVGSKN
ncbi:MAG: CpsD/CapB family tyrosine-protein kinase, partial [Pirellulaceae bacterium]